MTYSIRRFRQTDAADLARAANHHEVSDRLRDSFPHPYLFKDAAAFIKEASGGNTALISRAICSDDVVIGVVSLIKGQDVNRKTAELGYFVAPAYRGRGLVAQAIIDIAQEAFENEDLLRIYALPFADNHASRRVLEKAGFSLEATLRNGAFKSGQPVDTCIYALLND